MESGIRPSEEQIKEYNTLKINPSLRCLIYSISKDEKSIENVFQAGRDFLYKDLYEQLPSNEPRFVLYDFDYETDEKPPRKTNKLLLIFWCPDSSSIKKKFVFASSKESIKRSFTGIQKDIQASDLSEIDYDVVRKELLKA